MTMDYRQPTLDDVAAMAQLASAAQHEPAYHIAYLGLAADSIAADVVDLVGWADATTIAVDGDRLVGWLLGEVDPEMGRVWWWGPFVAAEVPWSEVADELYRRTRDRLPEVVTEEEACSDTRSTAVEGWCARHGFVAEEASVLLSRDPGPAAFDPRVRPMAAADQPTVKALHDAAFPATHLTPAGLVAADDPRLVIEVDGAVVGYVAYERQSDGSGYIDYLAVDEAWRGRGLGRALVEHACQQMFADGVSRAHLTVRQDNAAARALYRHVGFVEERLARPYRIGFRLS